MAPRVFFAILIAPVAPALLFLLFFSLLMFWDRSVFSSDTGSVVGWTAFVGYLGFFLLGLPAIFVLGRAGRLQLRPLLVAGAICGAAAQFLFFAALFGVSSVFPMSLPSAAYLALWGAVPGSIVAFTYWLIAIMRHNRTVERDARKGSARPSP